MQPRNRKRCGIHLVGYEVVRSYLVPSTHHQELLQKRRSGYRFVVTLTRSPERLIIASFLGAIVLGSILLALPVAHQPHHRVSFLDALFTAVSSVCVTGLTVVDTSTTWNAFGKTILITLVQIGGFGFMTSATLLAMVVKRRLGIRNTARTTLEMQHVHAPDVRSAVMHVLLFTVLVESIVFVVLFFRFFFTHDFGLSAALYFAIFHAVSAFNHGGFSLFPDSMMQFVNDFWICGIIGIAVTCGSIGAPVFAELRNHRKGQPWSLHLKMVLSISAVLIGIGTVWILCTEWTNPMTLGKLSPVSKVVAAWFQSVMTRSAGFMTIDINHMRSATWMLEDAFMFIGGATGSSAGGIKVTTLGVLLAMAFAEVRGRGTTTAFRRTIPIELQRVSVTILLVSTFAIGAGATVLIGFSHLSLDRALFEAISAYCTVGLSTGITMGLGVSGKCAVITLMFIGRVGLLTLASALVSRRGNERFSYPSETLGVG